MRTLLVAMLISLGAAAQTADATSPAQPQPAASTEATPQPSSSMPFGLKQAAQPLYSFDPPALGTYSFMLQKSVNALNAAGAEANSAQGAGSSSATSPGSPATASGSAR